MIGTKPLKVFCPVCDVAFPDEMLVFEHLHASHDLNTEMGPQINSMVESSPMVDAGGALVEDWVMIEAASNDDDLVEVFDEEPEAWPDDRLRMTLPSDRELSRLIRHMSSDPERGFLAAQLELTFPNGVPDRFYQVSFLQGGCVLGCDKKKAASSVWVNDFGRDV